MTDNRNLKRAIRARMAVTGEPYTLARRMVLAERAKNTDGEEQ